MDKKDFGHLVAILRKECRNEFDETMSQYDLAQTAQIPLITLQKIEQGRQANIKSDMLLHLAEALNLSSRARQVFFLASLGMQDSIFAKQIITPQKVLDELTQALSQLQTPAFISDGFGDIIATNLGFPTIFNMDMAQFHAPLLLSQHNINRLWFSPEFESQRTMMGESQFDFARQSIMLFKLWSLKYRTHWYFQRLLPELNRYPVFREHWQSPLFHDEDIIIQHIYITLKHPKLGLLKFLLGPRQALTKHGDLNLFSFQPLDVQTAETCLCLAQKIGTEVIRIAPWPKPATPCGWINNFQLDNVPAAY